MATLIFFFSTMTPGIWDNDVSKLLEHAPQKGTLGKHSVIDENLVHGTYGVHLALNLRLPLGVINIMGTHTPQVGKKPKSIEGLFICYADYASADPHFLANGLPLIINTIDFKFYRWPALKIDLVLTSAWR